MRSRTPKLLHPLCGRPIIAWPVSAARAAAAGRIVVVDGPEEPLRAAVDGQAEIAIQRQPRGTGDAVAAATAQIDPGAPVLVLMGDVPLISAATIEGLLRTHTEQGAAATMATIVLEHPGSYGRVVRTPDGTVERVAEAKVGGDATELELKIREVNTGIYVFDGGALLDALPQLRPDNAQGELYLTDVLQIMRARERSVIAFELEDPDETIGINDRRQLAQARAVAQRRIMEQHMLAGVTVVVPDATVIDADVTIGEDTVIAPFTSVLGATAIGRASTIGPNATLIDARVGDGAKILHSYVQEATIGDRVSVGPFAYLRPGSELKEGAKAGTFVELKNTVVGAGSKVPHLSYIGDAEIGEGTNLGASTITANYDGYRKHRTKIGDRVHTSVDTTLVAPVELGDDAHTGAGSVITGDVPAGSLGIARAHQKNIDGYNDRWRARGESQDGRSTDR